MPVHGLHGTGLTAHVNKSPAPPRGVEGEVWGSHGSESGEVRLEKKLPPNLLDNHVSRLGLRMGQVHWRFRRPRFRTKLEPLEGLEPPGAYL
jgi:hypothetical protein